MTIEEILNQLPNAAVRTVITDAMRFVATQVVAAEKKHARGYNSPHEGWAVIREEVDELWDEVKGNRGRTPAAAIEAAHVASTAIRYIAHVSEDHP